METLWHELMAKWRSHNVKLNQPATLQAVELFEKERRLVVPTDFKSYLLNVNGMDENSWETDDDFICFWALKNLKSLADDNMCSGEGVLNANEYFTFADHSIRVYDFAVRFTSKDTESTPVYFVAGPPHQITATFTEFIERYIAGDEDVIYPNP